MSGNTPEPAERQSGWTIDTVLEYTQALMEEIDRRYEQRFEAQEKAVNAALIAAKEAVDKAERAAEQKFAATNEFRGQLSDQAGTFMPRIEAEQRIQVNADRVGDLTSRLDRIEGQTKGSTATTALVFALLGAAGVLVGIIATVVAVAGH